MEYLHANLVGTDPEDEAYIYRNIYAPADLNESFDTKSNSIYDVF